MLYATVGSLVAIRSKIGADFFLRADDPSIPRDVRNGYLGVVGVDLSGFPRDTLCHGLDGRPLVSLEALAQYTTFLVFGKNRGCGSKDRISAVGGAGVGGGSAMARAEEAQVSPSSGQC